MNHNRRHASISQADRGCYSAVQVELVVVVATTDVGEDNADALTVRRVCDGGDRAARDATHRGTHRAAAEA